jgi:hypothetical protein
MKFKWQIVGLTAALVFVEVAAYWKLASFLRWTNEPLLAFTSALAFVALLLASIIAMGSSIPDGMRKQIYLGGVWLFIVQGLANVLISFEYGITGIPIEVVTRFFNSEPEMTRKVIAVIAGASLSVVSIAFWSLIGLLIRRHTQKRDEHLNDIRKTEDELDNSQNEEDENEN